jgi:site-specific recombinase XerD
VGPVDKEEQVALDSGWTTTEVLAAFDDYLCRARGVCAGTRGNYVRWVREFLDVRFPDGRVEVEVLGSREVIEFISAASGRYQPRTLEGVATSLRSFFRFCRAQGLGSEGLEDTVPMVPHRRSGLVRHVDSRTFNEFIASLYTASTRDRSMILCMARLGLRVGEVCRLRLDDLDWRQGVISVRTRKTGRGARLPITSEVGNSLVKYLQHGRPETAAREVFVLNHQRPGEPVSGSVVGRVVQRALERAGIEAPTRGGNLLRHSLATDLQAKGVSLVDIAGLLGHSCLATTRIYAAVDVEALSEVALPWPVRIS